jgi:phosphinothricin acetyltransferase
MIVRASTIQDMREVTSIYAHYVLHSTATFEETPPDEAEMTNRRAAILESGLPHLVAELDGEVTGFAWAAPWRTRPAYRFSAEDSIYLRPGLQRRGIGRRLLAEVIQRCEAASRQQLVAVIGDSANAASIGLHEALGFRRVGVLTSIGWKFERWVDTVLMQRGLAAKMGSDESRSTDAAQSSDSGRK